MKRKVTPANQRKMEVPSLVAEDFTSSSDGSPVVFLMEKYNLAEPMKLSRAVSIKKPSRMFLIMVQAKVMGAGASLGALFRSSVWIS